MDRNKISSLKTFTFNILSSASGFIFYMFIARVLDHNQYGIYVFVISVISLSGVFVSFGTPTLLIRESAKCAISKTTTKLKDVFSFSFLVTTLNSFVFLAVFYLFFDRQPYARFYIFPFVVFFILYLQQLISLLGSVLSGFGKNGLSSFLALVQSVLLLITFYLLYRSNVQISFYTVLLLQLFILFLSFMLYRVFVGSFIDLRLTKYDANDFRKMTLSALPFLGIGAAYIVNTQADIFLLGVIVGPEYSGVYQIGTKVASVLVIALGSVAVVYQPMISAFYYSKDDNKLLNQVKIIGRYGFFTALIFAIFFTIFGKEIISISFGQKYLDSYYAAEILIFARLINASVGGLGPYLSMTEKSKVLFLAVAIESICNVLLNVLLIPRMSYVGSALATGSSMAITNIILAIYTNKKYGVNSFFW